MSSAQHPDLDLQARIRPGLDILANEIVIALKKRTRFKRNAPVYRGGLVHGAADQSLLYYTLASIEQSHAELGRYTFAAQDAYTEVANVKPVMVREAPQSPVRQRPSGVGERILEFYQQWLDQACDAGDDSASYGETATADVVALLAIMERVNLGKMVAESKFNELREDFITTGGDREEMLKLIVRKEREAKVLALAQQLGENYGLAPVLAVSVFEFMIEVTVDIEVDYLRFRISEES